MADESKNYVAHWHDGSLRGPVALLTASQTTGAGTVYMLPKPHSAFGLEYFRGTTSATNESTAATVVIQGRLGSTRWYTLGASLTVNSATPAIARSTNSIPVTQVRATISSFTTSAGAASTAERKIPITVYLTAGVGSS